MKLKFKNDKYRRNRGGYSRLLELSCSSCKTKIGSYQKDGPGILKRLYIDRIIFPINTKKNNLECNKCGTLIGIYTIYKKENRPIYRLFAGAIDKKIIKNSGV